MKWFQCSPRSKHKCSQVRLPGVAPCQRVFFQRTGAHTVRLYRVTHTKGSDLCKCNLWYRWATFSNGYTCRSSVVVVREGLDKIMNLELISTAVVKLDWTVKTSDVPWCGQYSFQKVLASCIIGGQNWTQATHVMSSEKWTSWTTILQPYALKSNIWSRILFSIFGKWKTKIKR